jgi:site-specific recombinase XerD
MTKTQAQRELLAILAPLNAEGGPPSGNCSFGDFVNETYLPFYRRKWKLSSTVTNEDRISHHLSSELASRSLSSFTRDELQELLERKAAAELSFSTVDHVRWDLKQIFGMAVSEGFIPRNPAELLFTPRSCQRAQTWVMSIQNVRTLLSVLGVREQLIARLAVAAGMRPGEIFALKWGRLEADYADIQERLRAAAEKVEDKRKQQEQAACEEAAGELGDDFERFMLGLYGNDGAAQ